MSIKASSEKPMCKVLRAGESFIGKQGLNYAPGVSAETAGSQGIHLQIVTMPPGAKAKAHLHENHETAIYLLTGEAGMWYGENLQEHMINRPGDYVYIPANVPHLPYNRSETEPCTALIARTDPNEQESVVLLPELEKR
jgi:uncharacterized RmlC-like cupin family protein